MKVTLFCHSLLQRLGIAQSLYWLWLGAESFLGCCIFKTGSVPTLRVEIRPSPWVPGEWRRRTERGGSSWSCSYCRDMGRAGGGGWSSVFWSSVWLPSLQQPNRVQMWPRPLATADLGLKDCPWTQADNTSHSHIEHSMYLDFFSWNNKRLPKILQPPVKWSGRIKTSLGRLGRDAVVGFHGCIGTWAV